MNHAKDGNELFYDTYALFALATGVPSYSDYAKAHKITTTLMNLYELYYIMLQAGKLQLAQEYFQELLSDCIEITPKVVQEAAIFRLKNSRKKFSYIDCLGYTVTRQNEMLFLTGDKSFKGIAGVLFVQ